VYADALMLSAKPARQLEGLRLLDASCSAGVIRACDEGLLLATICAELRQDSPLCDELRQQNALPAVHREPNWEPRPLPSSLLACFQGDVTDTAGAIDCAGCSEAPKKRVTMCLEPSRLLWLTDVWDEQPVQWMWRAGRWHAFDGTSEVASVGAEGSNLRFGDDDGHAFSRVPAARNVDLRRDVAALPTVRQACDARSRCERTLADVLRHTGQANDETSWGEGEAPEHSLAGCLRSLRTARRELEAIAPARAGEACVLPGSPP
jgi:hypothetical protein